jgi:hypothetical protein
MPTDAYWGVDSVTAPDHKLSIAGHPTLYEHITKLAGQMPDFWGRYIGGHYAITAKEADALFDLSGGQCRILLAYNGATNTHTSVGGGRAQGIHDAGKAVKAAKHVGVPPGVMIFADIEPNWHCTQEWFEGWFQGMFASQYGGMGGVYENPLAWNARNFRDPYIKAVQGDSPFIFMDPPSKARYLWSQQPNKGCKFPRQIDFGYIPAEPAGLSGVTVVWQYAINCLKPTGGKWGLIDMDLANDLGYNVMWRAPVLV